MPEADRLVTCPAERSEPLRFREVTGASAPPASSWASGTFCLGFLAFLPRLVLFLTYLEVAGADVSKSGPDFAPAAEADDADSKLEPDFVPAAEADGADSKLEPDFALEG